MFNMSSNNKKYINKLDYSYQFNHNIERVFTLFKNFQIISILSCQSHFIPISINKVDISSFGSVFEGNFFGKIPYIAKLVKLENFSFYKKLKWEFYCKKDNNLILTISQNLNKVSEDDTTIIYIKLKFYYIYDFDKDFRKHIDENIKSLEEKIDKILNESSELLIQYESGIIKSNMEEIWNYLLNFDYLKKIAPLLIINGTEDLTNIKMFENVTINTSKKSFNIYCEYLDKKPEWKKWLIVFKLSSGEYKIPNNKLIIEITKINENECQLAMLNQILEPTSQEYIKEISFFKKYIISSIKDYLENYKN